MVMSQSKKSAKAKKTSPWIWIIGIAVIAIAVYGAYTALAAPASATGLAEEPQDQQVVVVCRSGNRSATGRDILLDAGFTEVTSMGGGMNTWISQGFETVTGP